MLYSFIASLHSLAALLTSHNFLFLRFRRVEVESKVNPFAMRFQCNTTEIAKASTIFDAEASMRCCTWEHFNDIIQNKDSFNMLLLANADSFTLLWNLQTQFSFQVSANTRVDLLSFDYICRCITRSHEILIRKLHGNWTERFNLPSWPSRRCPQMAIWLSLYPWFIWNFKNNPHLVGVKFLNFQIRNLFKCDVIHASSNHIGWSFSWTHKILFDRPR